MTQPSDRDIGHDLENAIRAYARQIVAIRAAEERHRRRWETVYELIAKAGGIRSDWKTP